MWGSSSGARVRPGHGGGPRPDVCGVAPPSPLQETVEPPALGITGACALPRSSVSLVVSRVPEPYRMEGIPRSRSVERLRSDRDARTSRCKEVPLEQFRKFLFRRCANRHVRGGMWRTGSAPRCAVGDWQQNCVDFGKNPERTVTKWRYSSVARLPPSPKSRTPPQRPVLLMSPCCWSCTESPGGNGRF